MLKAVGHTRHGFSMHSEPEKRLHPAFYWLGIGGSLMRDFMAALMIGLIVGVFIMRVFFVGPLRVLGFWGLLSLI